MKYANILTILLVGTVGVDVEAFLLRTSMMGASAVPRGFGIRRACLYLVAYVSMKLDTQPTLLFKHRGPCWF